MKTNGFHLVTTGIVIFLFTCPTVIESGLPTTSPASRSQGSWMNGDLVKDFIEMSASDEEFSAFFKNMTHSDQSQSGEELKAMLALAKNSLSDLINSNSTSDLLNNVVSSGSLNSLISPNQKALNVTTSEKAAEKSQLCETVQTYAETSFPMDMKFGTLLKYINVSASVPDALASKSLKELYEYCQMKHSPVVWKQCQNDIKTVLQALQTKEQWALYIIDSSGKPGKGILRGNTKYLSNYKQCQGVSHHTPDSHSIIEGKICRLFIKPPKSLGIPSIYGSETYIQWDVCFPKSCLDTDMQLYLTDNQINDVYVSCTAELDLTDDWSAIFAICMLGIFGTLMITGTLCELFIAHQRRKSSNKEKDIKERYAATSDVNEDKNGVLNEGAEIEDNYTGGPIVNSNGEVPMVEFPIPDGNNTYSRSINRDPVDSVCHDREPPSKTDEKNDSVSRWTRALLAFSIPRNTAKIFSVKASPGSIGCLHGIRVLSLGWVIIGHIMLYQTSAGQFENKLDILEQVQTFSFQIILNAPLSVDTFFVMSGLLTCYLFLKKLGKKGRITCKEFVLYYVHRYLRLTPSMMIWVMINACLMKYVGEGRPAWKDYDSGKTCRDYWWTNMLYINNVYKQSKSCIGVTWFVSCDMQLYIVAPLALIPWLYGKKILGFIMASLYVAIHLASNIWLEVEYNADGYIANSEDYQNHIYYKTYTRAAPYAIGLMMGWMLWKTKCKVHMNKYFVFVAWVACFGIILVLTFVSYDQNQDILNPAYRWTHVERAIFMTLYRPLWAATIAWIIFACATGYGGYIDSILSWNGWLPFSRLTYSAFIVHQTIIFYEGFNPQYQVLFTLTSVAYMFCGFYAMTYAVAYLLTVSVESPMLVLEKVILG